MEVKLISDDCIAKDPSVFTQLKAKGFHLTPGEHNVDGVQARVFVKFGHGVCRLGMSFLSGAITTTITLAFFSGLFC